MWPGIRGQSTFKVDGCRNSVIGIHDNSAKDDDDDDENDNQDYNHQSALFKPMHRVYNIYLPVTAAAKGQNG